ncbi:MAG: HAD-IC family P-type ATPase [Desulfuromonas sp.]|nr:HAD-IC family P-type ATPase [Desulfuromonas sp.]
MKTTDNAAPPATQPCWHAQDYTRVAQTFGTDLSHGLSSASAADNLSHYGLNQLHRVAKTSWYVVVARQFSDILIFILLAAAAISLIVGELGDAVTILVIVLFNGILGFVQEWKAENAIEALQQMLEPRCTVVREGKEQVIDSKLLVPGDIVLLKIGDHVPADIRLTSALNLKVNESSLTGESDSVGKDTPAVSCSAGLAERSSMVWMGTAITNGRARGIVIATGMSSEFGRIAELTQSVTTEATPLQQQLGQLGKQLGILSVTLSFAVALCGWLMHKPLMEMFLTGIALAVAVVPEGLPAVVTITLALGVRSMVQRQALLRRLQAAETLGAATVICTDKTGTLTKNQMTVQHIWLPSAPITVTGNGYDPAGHFEQDGHKIELKSYPELQALLTTGLHCNHASVGKHATEWQIIGEPTEAALIVAAYKGWLTKPDTSYASSEFSFNSNRKRMTIIDHRPDGLVAHVKGAPEVILPRCAYIQDQQGKRLLSAADVAAATTAYQQLAEQGLRTLALARRELASSCKLDEESVEDQLTLLGIVGIIDPPHAAVPQALRIAADAGIRTIMITGDAAATALAIAKSIGLDAQQAITGAQIKLMDDATLQQALTRKVLFARTTPEDKMRIVQMLQQMGEVVGMTGDGVNDAPALKRADIGIAMGIQGTDVAKGAADMILVDDNFASIINAVEEGRRQYANIQKFVRYLLSSNMGELVAIFFNIILAGPLIFLPVQILWMNLVTDGMTAVALGLEPAEKQAMRQPPRAKNALILNRHGILMIVALGSYLGLATLWLFHHYIESGDPQQVMVAQTVAFTAIIVLEKMNVFNFRALTTPLSVIGFFSNPWVLLAWLLSCSLQVGAVYLPFLQTALHTVPLGWQDWLVILATALPIFIATELLKWLHWRRGGAQSAS